MQAALNTLAALSLFILVAVTQPAFAQQPVTQSPDDVVRVNTELVQTRVSVFDKNGKLVTGLAKDDFNLSVDGKSMPISFFENIVAGSSRDHSDRSVSNTQRPPENIPKSLAQRTLVFFLDDRHLSLDSLVRTRKMLLDFIEKEMGPKDLVAIASTSGQIGFLQQFTDNKDVLRAAVGRLNHIPYVVTDYAGNSGAPLTEYMALTIERREDTRVTEFYVQDCLKYAPRGTRQERASIRRHCEIEVANRARQILVQAATATANTYDSLRSLLDTAQKMTGSKLAFFISDGFLADAGPRGLVGRDHLLRLTEEARQSGVVFYTIDARGLVSNSLDASGNVPLDDSGVLASARSREIAASQDALNALAVDTGGRALRNQNYFDGFVTDALAETSQYYLFAWRPESADVKTASRKIQVTVKGRPELSVRLANMFLSKTSEGTITKKPDKPETPEADLRQALTDSHVRRALPLHLSLIYFDTPDKGSLLTTSVQAPTEVLSYGSGTDQPAELSISGVVLTDQGKMIDSFGTTLKVNQDSSNQHAPSGSNVIYNYPTKLKPGMYQVRVAARDNRSGLLGSSAQWIVVPDLTKGELALSSLIVGLQNLTVNSGSTDRVQWSVDRQFAHGSTLGFMLFIYNAKQVAGSSRDLSMRVQVLRGATAIVSTPITKITPPAQSDLQRLPYSGTVKLGQLSRGRYDLQVTVTDALAKKTVSQSVPFYIY